MTPFNARRQFSTESDTAGQKLRCISFAFFREKVSNTFNFLASGHVKDTVFKNLLTDSDKWVRCRVQRAHCLTRSTCDLQKCVVKATFIQKALPGGRADGR